MEEGVDMEFTLLLDEKSQKACQFAGLADPTLRVTGKKIVALKGRKELRVICKGQKLGGGVVTLDFDPFNRNGNTFLVSREVTGKDGKPKTVTRKLGQAGVQRMMKKLKTREAATKPKRPPRCRKRDYRWPRS